jgi:AraC-like DNA-binding protein
MNVVTYRPRAPLGDFVELLWLAKREGLAHRRERLLPMGTMELVIDLTDARQRPVVCGAHSEPFEIETSQPATILGVHFKRGGAFPFLGVPAGELHNSHVPLDALWGKRTAELHERVLEAATAATRFQVLEQALLAQATRPLVRHRAVAFALAQFEAPTQVRTVSEVVDRIGLSQRRFIELFRDEVGLTPKLYRRVERFQRLLQRVHGAPGVDWAEVALECGYYDQAHFVNEFRTFSGLNPSTYLEVRGEHLNHLPLAD